MSRAGNHLSLGRLLPAFALAIAVIGVPTADAAPEAPPAAKAKASAEVRALRRIPTPAGDRIVIELTREVAFVSSRLADPDRLFFDLADTDAVPELAGRAATLGGVLVKGLRIGRQNGATRVVLDLAGTPRYRVYPLTNPFRIVIELESDAVLAASADTTSTRAVATATVVGATPTSVRAANASPTPVASSVSASIAPVRYLGAVSSFTLDKPAVAAAPVDEFTMAAAPTHAPTSREQLRASFGVGYVEDADWGAEFQGSGSVSGIQLQWDGLASSGRRGLGFERGMFMAFDPDRHWRLEGGDMYSPVGGASRGLRFSVAARGNRRPAIAVITPRRLGDEKLVVSYRDQLRWRDQTILDAEIASDKSFYAATRWQLGRLSADFSHRRIFLSGSRITDRGLALGLELWHGLVVQGSGVRTEGPEGRADWVSAGFRVPVTRWFDFGVERSFTSVGDLSTISSAVMANVATNRVRLAHRYQWGATDVQFGDVLQSFAREQYQAMTSWTPGPRLSASLQLVTAWNDHGRAVSWEELQTTFRPTRTTSFSFAAPIQPQESTRDRVQLRLVQQFPKRFSLAADYGRVAPFQAFPGDNGRPRLRVMLSRSLGISTPARGGLVAGRVLDHSGRPVAGVRVMLGHYAVTTDKTGEYVFSPLPASVYELSLDEEYLPANYAWDGRRVRLDVGRGSRERINLGLTPLNAIHGRVYDDKNGNGQFDHGEGVQGVVVRTADRLTATDAEGGYSFYNLWPDTYAVAIDVARLPETLAPSGAVSLDASLGDARPATGHDFRLRARQKPILWEGASR